MTSHQVWLSSSISIGQPPPLWYSLPIRLWLVGTSWKTRYFRSDFLLLEEARFTFFLRRRMSEKGTQLSFSPCFIYGLDSNLVKMFLLYSNPVREAKRIAIHLFRGNEKLMKRWIDGNFTCSATNSESRWVRAAIEDEKFPSSSKTPISQLSNPTWFKKGENTRFPFYYIWKDEDLKYFSQKSFSSWVKIQPILKYPKWGYYYNTQALFIETAVDNIPTNI